MYWELLSVYMYNCISTYCGNDSCHYGNYVCLDSQGQKKTFQYANVYWELLKKNKLEIFLPL